MNNEPADMKRNVLAGVAIFGAALAGLGIIFWIAANWDALGRFGQFALLQILILASCAGAILRPQARLPLALIAVLGIGGLFAYFGQTYQTGADPWQLFAVWAALTLPICLSVRHDVTWTPWCIIALTAVSLWVQTQVSGGLSFMADDLPYHLLAWSAALLLCWLMSPPLRKWTGAGIWSLRLTVTLAVCMITLIAVAALFDSDVAAQFWFGLFIFLGGAIAYSRSGMIDIYILSILGLALNVLLIGLLIHGMFSGKSGLFASLFMITASAVFLLWLTVTIILHLARQSNEVAA